MQPYWLPLARADVLLRGCDVHARYQLLVIVLVIATEYLITHDAV